ncbi:MAG: phosphohistidine phosphatase SixA [Deferribacteres bacterium]|nr:phosphohistidine phosphatase SixA [Deferribacteres bacterium]
MNLYLVQHAESMSKEEDPTQSLSEKGIQDIKRVAAFAAKLNIRVHRIFHSGKMRALQTAQVLADHITVDTDISESEGLLPMDDPGIWFERISTIREDIMLVGHLPHMAGLSSLLLCGSSEKGAVNFERGCIVCMKRSGDGGWAVEWIIKPGMIR